MPQKKGSKSSAAQDIAKAAVIAGDFTGYKAPQAVKAAAKGQPSKKGGKSKKPPPGFFSDLGEVIGTVAGGAINGFSGKNIVAGMNQGAKSGRKIGGHVAEITGMGAYHLKSNSLGLDGGMVDEGAQVPQFGNAPGGMIRLRKAEYVQDLVYEANNSPFDRVVTQVLNPANTTLFPWLSRLAPLFQKYKFRGLVFFFKSTSSEYSTDVALGAVVMATNYNVNDSPFGDKQTMEASDYCVSVKPSRNMIHPIECDPSTLGQTAFYVRGGVDAGAVEDNRLYDMGLFQVALCGVPSAADGASLGELWVSYDVELLEPYISPDDSFTGASAIWAPTDVTPDTPFGDVEPAYNPAPQDPQSGTTILGQNVQWDPSSPARLSFRPVSLRKETMVAIVLRAKIPYPEIMRSKGLALSDPPDLTAPRLVGIEQADSSPPEALLVNGYLVVDDPINSWWNYSIFRFFTLQDTLFLDESDKHLWANTVMVVPPEIAANDGTFQSTSVALFPTNFRFKDYSSLLFGFLADQPGWRAYKPATPAVPKTPTAADLVRSRLAGGGPVLPTTQKVIAKVPVSALSGLRK